MFRKLTSNSPISWLNPSATDSMGNNTSTTRKSLATLNQGAPFRKSCQSQSDHHNLEEEFSDLILHEVKRQKYDPGSSDAYTSINLVGLKNPAKFSQINEQGHFSNDLLEDEFNELGHGILETGAGEEVVRNILPSEAIDQVDETGLPISAGTIDHSMVDQQGQRLGCVGDSRQQKPSSIVTGDPGVDASKLAVDSSGAAGSVAGSLSSSVSGSALMAGVDFTRVALPALARQRAQPLTTRLHGEKCFPGTDNGITHCASPLASVPHLVPVKIKWVNETGEKIAKVSIIGSFSNWRDVIKLKRFQHLPNEYLTTVKLPLGVHKLLFVVNNEYRVLELLPTATDQEGIFFNWFEVLDPLHLFNSNPNIYHHSNLLLGGGDNGLVQVAGEHDASQIQKKSMSFLAKISKQEKDGMPEHVEYAQDSGEHESVAEPAEIGSSTTNVNYGTYHEQFSTSYVEEYSGEKELGYSSEIPEMLVDYNYFKNKGSDYELPEPPQLPAHLNNVLLNKMSSNPQTHKANNILQVATGNRPPLRRADSSYYASNSESYHRAIPNHVILNHLMTTSIRNDVLTVACITRYSGKFVTQVMHSPADVIES